MKIKSVIVCLLTIVLIIGMTPVMATTEMPKGAEDHYARVEQKSLAVYADLCDSFYTLEKGRQFPDNYAGVYLNENKELVILIASQNRELVLSEMEDYVNAVNADDIIFETATYTHSYLSNLMRQFESEWISEGENPESVWCQIPSISFLEDKNCIVIRIIDIDDTKIERFKSEIKL